MNVNSIGPCNAASIHKLAITNTAQNIFASFSPITANAMAGSGFTIQNNSGNHWYMGFSNAVTVPGGALPGIKIAAGESITRSYGGGILGTGIWLISAAAGPDEGVLEQAC